MKTLLFAAALMVGGAAYAQDTTGQGGTTGGTGMSAGGQTVAPGNMAPKRDARGVKVISAPAEAPAGYNQPPSVGGTGAPPSGGATMAPAGPLPPCTRTRTDNCTQTYERNHGAAGSSSMAGGTGDAGTTAAAAGDDAAAGGDTTTTTTKTTHHRRTTHRRRHK